MGSDSQPDDEVEQLRERYRELLEELRTIIPGSQVLLAFLLTVPFSSGFDDLDDLGRKVFTAVLLGVAAATALFLAPAVHHRTAPDEDRKTRLRLGIALTVAGMALLAASVSAAVFVVTRYIFDDNAWVGVASGAAVATFTATLWYVVPLVRLHRRRD
ncbi:DUF6328 family protein [Nocardia sputi]|uniref:DUF6328 family protein n=1 Tax=Nocardia sputi TaxID=2943705 RepID=UPI0020BD8EC8|nr:DUF6328 family protein [Nocardia sputi]